MKLPEAFSYKKEGLSRSFLNTSPLLPDVRKDLFPDLQTGSLVRRHTAAFFSHGAHVADRDVRVSHPLHLLNLFDEIFCRRKDRDDPACESLCHGTSLDGAGILLYLLRLDHLVR